MENAPLHDLPPEQYATLIRELIKHEDVVTNHRIMWLLVIQGLLVNVYAQVREQTRPALVVALAGVVVTLSAFFALYKSYQARRYLRFLGEEVKRGSLEEEYVPLDGWPTKRIKDWRRGEWLCPWFRAPADLLEPLLLSTILYTGDVDISSLAGAYACSCANRVCRGVPGNHNRLFRLLRRLGVVRK